VPALFAYADEVAQHVLSTRDGVTAVGGRA